MRLLLFFLLFSLASRAYCQEIPSVKIEELSKIIDTSRQPLVVNFWATWCAPCVEEIPWFERQVRAIKEKNVRLILVSLDFREDYPQKISAFKQRKRLSSQVLWLNETNADHFCPYIDESWEGGIPATLFVNNEKKYRRFIGAQVAEKDLREELNKLIQ